MFSEPESDRHRFRLDECAGFVAVGSDRCIEVTSELDNFNGDA